MLKNKMTCVIQIIGRRSVRSTIRHLALAVSSAQNFINVRVAGGTPGAPSGATASRPTGDRWNYFANVNRRGVGGGWFTNAVTIKDSCGATVSGVGFAVGVSPGNVCFRLA